MTDSMGDSFYDVSSNTFDIDDEVMAELMPAADSPTDIRAELMDSGDDGFNEIDSDASLGDVPYEDIDDIAEALEDYGYSVDDLSKKPNEYEFKRWVANETDVSKSEAGKAGHEARDGMEDIAWIPPSRSASKES